VTYAPLDDCFDDCPKYADRDAAEMGIIACAITYATRNLSDGRVPRRWPGRRFGREGERLAARMLDLGVWSVRPDGDYEIVGYLEHNPSRDQVMAKRAKKAEAGRAGGKASWSARGGPKTEAKREAPASAPASPARSGSAEPNTLHFTDLPSLSSDPVTEIQKLPENAVADERESGVVPVSADRCIGVGDKITAELREAAAMLGVQDIDGAWLKFCGKNAGQWRHVAGSWQAFCVSWSRVERADRDRDRARQSPQEPPGAVEARRVAIANAQAARDAKDRRERAEAVPLPVDGLRKIGIKL
jgi:hypothetical protein